LQSIALSLFTRLMLIIENRQTMLQLERITSNLATLATQLYMFFLSFVKSLELQTLLHIQELINIEREINIYGLLIPTTLVRKVTIHSLLMSQILVKVLL